MSQCLTCGGPLLERVYYRKDGGIKERRTPKKYCSLSCAGKAAHKTQFQKRRGWHLDRHGYKILGGGGKYQQPEHRAVMEKILGRKLEKWETVHHKDGNRQNNAPDNLELWASRHGRGQRTTDLPMTPGIATAFLSFGT